MYSIIINNVLIHRGVMNKYKKYKKLGLMNTFCFWHVNSFTLISGIVGFKTSKYTNLLFLWLCALFYSIYFHLIFKIFKSIAVKDKNIFYNFFLLFSLNFVILKNILGCIYFCLLSIMVLQI